MVRYVALALVLLVAVGICFAAGGFAGIAWLWQLPLSVIGSLLGVTIVWFLILWVASLLVDTEKPQEKEA